MRTPLILFAGLFLFSATSVANPVMLVQELSGVAVAGPHVKLTYTADGYAGTAVGATTYGTSHSPWTSAGSSVSRDTGSGVRSIPLLEMCDCHVPAGQTLAYQVVFASGGKSFVIAQVWVPATPVTAEGCAAECQEADAVDAAVTDAPASTDVTPETAGVQRDGFVSLDTLVSTGGAVAMDAPVATGGQIAVDAPIATGGTVAAGGAVVTGGALATGGVQVSTTPAKSKGGGCSFLPVGSFPTLPYLALLGAAIVGWRRRS